MSELHTDIVVVGGGPAGSAAALEARRTGLRVVVVEAAGFPRFRPGETMSTPACRLLEALLGPAGFAALPGATFQGIRRATPAPALREEGGRHVARADLDAALLEAARAAGAVVLQPARALGMDSRGAQSVVVRTTRESVHGRFVIDASGGTRWLSRALDIEHLQLTHALRLDYGYRDGPSPDVEPVFAIDPLGWHWRTGLSDRLEVNVGMRFAPAAANGEPRDAALPRHSNASWRIASQLSAPHFALVGDAACQLDPAGAPGVARALSSAIEAVQAAARHLAGDASHDALLDYCMTTTTSFLGDCKALHLAYRNASAQPDPVGFVQRCTTLFAEDSHVA